MKLLYSAGIGVRAISLSNIRHARLISTIDLLHIGQAYPLKQRNV